MRNRVNGLYEAYILYVEQLPTTVIPSLRLGTEQPVRTSGSTHTDHDPLANGAELEEKVILSVVRRVFFEEVSMEIYTNVLVDSVELDLVALDQQGGRDVVYVDEVKSKPTVLPSSLGLLIRSKNTYIGRLSSGYSK